MQGRELPQVGCIHTRPLLDEMLGYLVVAVGAGIVERHKTTGTDRQTTLLSDTIILHKTTGTDRQTTLLSDTIILHKTLELHSPKYV